MQKPTRRNLLAGLLSLPVFGKFALALAPVPEPGAADEPAENPARLRAVQLLRFINTAEAWHFGKFGRYATLDELRKSEAVAALLRHETAARKGIGQAFYATLRFNSDEIIPGWKLALRIGDGAQLYTATLDDVSEEGVSGEDLGALSSDQQGKIYHGESLQAQSAAWTNAQTSLNAPRSLGARSFAAKNESRAASLLKTVALGSFQRAGDFCCYGCCYCGSCFSTWVPGCYNCGCGNCIWCC